MAFMN